MPAEVTTPLFELLGWGMWFAAVIFTWLVVSACGRWALSRHRGESTADAVSELFGIAGLAVLASSAIALAAMFTS